MERFEDILSRVLKIEKAKIKDELTLLGVDAWNSMNALILVSVLESNYGIRFTAAEIISVKCIGDIKATLRNKGVTIDGA